MRLFMSAFVCCFLLLSCGCSNSDLKTEPGANKGAPPDTTRPVGGGSRRDINNFSQRGD
jgi:hypothetical protein